jgi:hypothetical protein
MAGSRTKKPVLKYDHVEESGGLYQGEPDLDNRSRYVAQPEYILLQSRPNRSTSAVLRSIPVFFAVFLLFSVWLDAEDLPPTAITAGVRRLKCFTLRTTLPVGAGRAAR